MRIGWGLRGDFVGIALIVVGFIQESPIIVRTGLCEWSGEEWVYRCQGRGIGDLSGGRDAEESGLTEACYRP